MNKTRLRLILVMITLPLLGGCATFFKMFEANDEKQSDEQKIDEVVKPQLITRNIVDAETKNVAEEKPSGIVGSGKVKLYPGTGVFVKAPVPAPVASVVKPAAGDEMMLNFEGADLREVVKAIIGDIFNETYIIDPKVQGVINLHTSSPLQRKDLLPTLETLLRMNGAAIIREEGIYKIVPAATATRGSITPQLGDDRVILPAGRGYSVQIAPLKFIAAKEMVKILEPFVTEANAVRIDEARNLIILSGTERELRHLQDTIAMFDVDWLAGMSVALFTLQSVDVKTAVADLNKIFGAQALSPLAGVVKLVPIERLNAILVITQQPKYLEQAKIWIERMDHSGGTGGGMRLFVYPVQNGMAEKLAALINNVFTKSTTSTSLPPALAPGLAPAEVKSTESTPVDATQAAEALAIAGDSVAVKGDVRVIADKDNNALLILASPANYEKIEAAIRKLDVPPRQVLIDVTIAEVTLTGDLKFGLEWAFKNGSRGSGKLDTGGPGISALAPGFSYVLSNANVVGGVASALNLLATDSRVKVISSPHIMVTDNQTAKIQVGDRVPITSQTQSVLGSTTGLIASIQYIDTGILLTVTPRINAGGQVTMDINQEVSAAAITTTSSINSPTISKRAVKTTVVVKSGETMVLGGLITDNKTNASSGLPYLSKIPFIGGLFGTQSIANNRTELVLLITPRLVANNQQARAVSEEFRKKLSGLGDMLEDLGKSSDISKKPAGLDESLEKIGKPGDIPKQIDDKQVKQAPLLR
ncbi:Type IV pilus biogenesis and competence protein PilQ [Candidatus Nitrotoga sp. BS]|uniref:type II secretion system secretin GspD n=1 Tax=Candidatus Nitrotoga sp. BS TaxID=2890408 RepID=UPI001EF35762|nr:type II secretion system secretin GspD [Candidatus Nitrotoga sp. BS]CAH1190515.1 Type IV pilus biogenesis and competence protein PilQ [Candidatus Nitrotoga sp. BS]